MVLKGLKISQNTSDLLLLTPKKQKSKAKTKETNIPHKILLSND